MEKLFLSVKTMLLRVAPSKGHHAGIQHRKWILPIAVSAAIAATGGVAWQHLRPSAKIAPPHGVTARIDRAILRVSGSKTAGSVLGPELVKAWLASINASDVEETVRFGSGSNQIAESVISAKLNGIPVVVEVKARGAATAFADMTAGGADIGLTNREINATESTRLKSLNDLRADPLSLEQIALIVPRSNTVASISRSTLKKIFAGQITNWSALGLKPLPIHLYAPEKNTGVNDKFASLVLGDSPMANVKRVEDAAELDAVVAGDPGAIGFSVVPRVRQARSVSISDEKAGAPLGRQVYLYTAATSRNRTAIDFLRFAISPDGQNIVRQGGFIPAQQALGNANNSPTSASPPDGPKLSVDERVKQILSTPPRPAITPPSDNTAAPNVAGDLPNAPSRPPLITASLVQPTRPPATTASQPPAVAPPAPAAERAPQAAEAAPALRAPERLAPPPMATPVLPPTFPIALNSHATTASDYPLASMRLQEQGTVQINYMVQEDGSVGDCTVMASSGKSLLDDAACAMVQQRWKFKPATQDGKPVAIALTAEVAFKLADLAKAPKPETLASLFSPPAAKPAVKAPPDPGRPVALTSHVVEFEDYPVRARSMQLQGNVVVDYLVAEDGSVDDCLVTTSSGKTLLDDAACTMVKRRWRFKPAMRDGKPVEKWLRAEVAFKLK